MDKTPRVVSALLVGPGVFWLAAGAAGGSELPAAAEPFKMSVALPVALGMALGWGPSHTARLSASAEGFDDEAGRLAALESQSLLARILGDAIGAPLFACFEIWPGDWASTARDPADLLGPACQGEGEGEGDRAGEGEGDRAGERSRL